MLRQYTLRLPFAWLTLRLEAPAMARHRSIFPVFHPPIDTSMPLLRQGLPHRLLVDMGLDRSRMD